MRETDSSQIALGPGGLILPENKELLEEIRKTPPLPPIALLKLATFFSEYQTNRQLGDHLMLIGLSKLVGDPKVQEAATKPRGSVGNILTASADDASDWLEDWFDGGDEADDVDTTPVNFYSLLEVKWIHHLGLGLLIETPLRKHKHEQHYVIGVSPNPQSL